MSEETQATRIIDRWPGETRPDRRRALASALGHPDDEKVRYWEKKGEIPQREWQSIIDVAAAAGIIVLPEEFVRHLRAPADATTDSAAA